MSERKRPMAALPAGPTGSGILRFSKFGASVCRRRLISMVVVWAEAFAPHHPLGIFACGAPSPAAQLAWCYCERFCDVLACGTLTTPPPLLDFHLSGTKAELMGGALKKMTF